MIKTKNQEVMKCKSKYWMTALLLVLNVYLIEAQSFTENKNVVKRYKIYPGSTLDITNKYGKIEFVNWDKDSAMIEAFLKIQTNSASRMSKLRNSIDFDFSITNHYIVAKTVFKTNGNAIISGIKNIAESIVYNGDEVKIDYIVTIPKNINIRVNNKYGDVYADDIDGDIRFIVANGGFKANNLTGNVSIELSFGDGTLNKMDKGRLAVSYSDFTVKEANQLNLESKSSKINIENVESLKLKSRHDKLQLGSLKFLTGETDFSDIWINSLTEEMNLNTKFGSITTDNIRKGFSFVNINSELTDLSLFFERGSTYQYDITYFKDAFIRLPKEAVKSEDKIASYNTLLKLSYGYLGSAESAAKVKIFAAKKASVSLFMR